MNIKPKVVQLAARSGILAAIMCTSICVHGPYSEAAARPKGAERRLLHICTTKDRITKAADEIALKWDVKQLHVAFLNGSAAMQKHVREVAPTWSKWANITFIFDNRQDSEIKIRFANDGESWSYIGTDAVSQKETPETMHFGWFTASTPEIEYQRTVLHEFGHALGLIHEHQQPAAAIHWNKPVVYAYYAGLNPPWSRKDVDQQLFTRYNAEVTNHTRFDPASIMEYPVEKNFTTDGFSIGWNTKLSSLDKQFIAKEYPK